MNLLPLLKFRSAARCGRNVHEPSEYGLGKRLIGMQTIGFDKLNQIRHVKFFRNADGVKAHMEKHRALIRPKFELLLATLDKELGDLGIASWTVPNGGYFFSLNVMDGCAKRVVELCKQAGVTLTPAGASFPYGLDPDDRNIRIAPTYPSLSDLEKAAEVCVSASSWPLRKRFLPGNPVRKPPEYRKMTGTAFLISNVVPALLFSVPMRRGQFKGSANHPADFLLRNTPVQCH